MAVFNQKKVVSQPSVSPAALTEVQKSIIGRTLLVKGEVLSDDEVMIEGKVEGRVMVKNRLVIGKNGCIEADIEAREVIIKGRVDGNVRGYQKVEIVPEGVLNGNIVSPKVVISEGAIFAGNIDMKARIEKPAEEVQPPRPSQVEKKPEEQNRKV